ncbi:nitrite reductase/ring-hydroxylating ferredoxin subunit [Chitinivorax tropicus]|uniref:Nitrite reductase/ring-hydroxylating ferredoxin subunit n=1 Tax=Chitinivorax tropicus TaxID=714531 RepID=A0A840MRT6_9PROT|nr:Rieske 2Fe-2S domain-containing protein [Chitinivorax tropicus]MBB5019827.1 nitrite reductase/ring-hydroxylating ferredoxin subunit [Chitinivorax tropicus]
MADAERLICAASELQEGGTGKRFQVALQGRLRNAFAIRWHGQVYAYVNECQHVPIELDWNEGQFFDLSGSYLVCATHGAYYAPDSGYCLGGPCKGRVLQKLSVIERDEQIFWIDETTYG